MGTPYPGGRGWLAGAFLLGILRAAVAAAAPSTAEHGRYPDLAGHFSDVQAVILACLGCHTEAAAQVRAARHGLPAAVGAQGDGTRGQLFPHVPLSPPPPHWKHPAASGGAAPLVEVDCLLCHDRTGLYPGPRLSRPPAELPDLGRIARAVGKTSRASCGNCHFHGVAGAPMGDLDASLAVPDKALDVHMDAAGLNFTCATCHALQAHDLAEARPARMLAGAAGPRAGAGDPAACSSCHGARPHERGVLDRHTRKLACQACHVPGYAQARGGAGTGGHHRAGIEPVAPAYAWRDGAIIGMVPAASRGGVSALGGAWEAAGAAGATRVHAAAYAGMAPAVPLSHKVAPKEAALWCGDCHAPRSRLAGLPGLYLPGHHRAVWLDRLGWGLVLAVLVVVLAHGAWRIRRASRL